MSAHKHPHREDFQGVSQVLWEGDMQPKCFFQSNQHTRQQEDVGRCLLIPFFLIIAPTHCIGLKGEDVLSTSSEVTWLFGGGFLYHFFPNMQHLRLVYCLY